jgi:putative transposase
MNNKKIDLSNFDFNEFKADALSQLKSGQCLTGKDGILTPLIKELLEAALEGEMEAHIAESQELGLSPRRNGKTSKLMKSSSGVFDLETPRDREGSFEKVTSKAFYTVLAVNP